MNDADEFDRWLGRANRSLLAATAASLDVEEALSIVKRRAVPDLASTPCAACRTAEAGAGPAPGGVAALLADARRGDSQAWEEIVRRYSGVVFATVRSFRLQDADVLDAVQMTWLRLAENSHRVVYPERLAGWLAITARRESLHILRQQARHIPALVPALPGDDVDPRPGPEQRVIDDDTARALWNLVAELSPLRRSLLRPLYTDNPRLPDDLARSMGIPPSGSGPTRARALQQLRRRLDEAGLGPTG